MDALKALAELDLADRLKRYPSAPAYAIAKRQFSDRTANELTTCVIRYLELMGHKAWRQSSEGRYRPGQRITDILGRVRQMEGQWLPGQNNGASDIACIVNGRFWAIEVKMNDKQSAAQKKYEQEVKSSGAVYLIVRNLESFVQSYKQLTL